MKCFAFFAALSLASLSYACTSEAPVDEDGTADESADELTKREGEYLGVYDAKANSIDEIQHLSLNNDNTFTGKLGTHLTGSFIVCIKAPCTVQAEGKWRVIKTWQGKVKLKLSPVGALDVFYDVVEGPGKTLELARGKVTVTLSKKTICPMGMPMPPYCPVGTKLISKQNADGCFAGWSCDKVICPVGLPAPPTCKAGETPISLKNDNGCFGGYKCTSCPQIEPNPPGQKCDGTWEPNYLQNGCFVGTRCVPAPVCPQIEPNPPFVKCDAAGKTWSKSYNADGCFLGTSCVARAQDGCVISGCNSEICAEDERYSICLANPAFDKFKADGVLCKKANGACTWSFPANP